MLSMTPRLATGVGANYQRSDQDNVRNLPIHACPLLFVIGGKGMIYHNQGRPAGGDVLQALNAVRVIAGCAVDDGVCDVDDVHGYGRFESVV